ncbi:hypothetical protein [Serratia proteamaculans]|uniref:hypothetical protein n=1 Tax=Serratia proteamaculans TaxID=28151 RepID=UPI00217959A7|nr:hypothetical protein [Serratia proteamaculans]CAI1974689.1 Uncharacterised protein [Serratia proteamaculans]
MTVSTEISREEYTGNGVTTDFDYRFRVFSADELVVSVADTTENISVLTLNTDYTVTGAGSRTGGKVKLTNPLAIDWRISIERDLPVTQETDIRNQGNFFPEVHEDAFDKLTMLIQQAFGVFGLALRKPNWLAKYYDAKGNRIANLGGPINGSDAATKDYVDTTGDGWFKRTLRVPEPYVNQLPSANTRRNSLQGYNSAGQPVPIFSMTETADLAIKLASHDLPGASLVGLPQGTVAQAVKTVTPEMFGAVGDGVADDTTAVLAMAAAGYSYIEFGPKKTYRLTDRILVSTLVRDINLNGSTLRVEHAGIVFLRVGGPGSGDPNTYNVRIYNGRVIGPFTRDSTHTAAQASTLGYFKDHCQLFDLWLSGFGDAFALRGTSSAARIYINEVRDNPIVFDGDFNSASDIRVNVCCGDGIIVKGNYNVASNITFNEAGIPGANPAPGDMVGGSVVAIAVDGVAASHNTLTNITARLWGVGGIIFGGQNNHVSDISLQVQKYTGITSQNPTGSVAVFMTGTDNSLTDLKANGYQCAIRWQGGTRCLVRNAYFGDKQGYPNAVSVTGVGDKNRIENVAFGGGFNQPDGFYLDQNGLTLRNISIASFATSFTSTAAAVIRVLNFVEWDGLTMFGSGQANNDEIALRVNVNANIRNVTITGFSGVGIQTGTTTTRVPVDVTLVQNEVSADSACKLFGSARSAGNWRIIAPSTTTAPLNTGNSIQFASYIGPNFQGTGPVLTTKPVHNAFAVAPFSVAVAGFNRQDTGAPVSQNGISLGFDGTDLRLAINGVDIGKVNVTKY